IFTSLIILSFSISVHAQKTFTADDYTKAVNKLGANLNKLIDRNLVKPQWLPDGNFWYSVKTAIGVEYVLVNTKDGKRKTSTKKEEIITTNLNNTKPSVKFNEVLSPDATKVAYIKNWNLYIKDIATKTEMQLTTDGEKDFGYATDNAGWTHSDNAILLWSPDSKKIATFKQDQRNVSTMYLVKTKVGAPELKEWKYPLPEDKEIVKIHRVIIDVNTGNIVKLKTAADDHRSTLCDDISCSGSFDDNIWSADGTKLAFVSTPRNHKTATLRIADATTGDVKDVLKEAVATQYESGWKSANWRYLPASNEIIWFSERDNWGHIYLYDVNTGKLKNQITKGNFVVTEILKVDEKNRTILFEGKGKEVGQNPYFNYYYMVDFGGKKIKLLTPESGNHSFNLSDDGKYFVDNFSKQNEPNTAVLRDINGKLITQLEKADITRLVATGWKAPVPFTVKSANGAFDLFGIMYQPSNLDIAKKYPVVNYIYPGPQGGGVGSWSFSAIGYSDHQALAELGFIVVVIEGSCNPNRSKAFHDACYGNMGDNTLPDQIEGLKQLQKKYSYLDLDKVGIWGHSGGGYATADAMFSYPDFYKVGISESGNHDNRNYEDDWGERYIGLIEGDNYKNQANQNHAKNLKGKLLIAHGNMDDNVPPSNSFLVADALIKANKDFDLVIFPNATHGYGADSYYMMRKRWDYFVQHLQGAIPPKEFQIKIVADTR
ncbi:MAG: DPP IV N-terminal domain-containing protein, partial [Ferruginibacter sp.]